MSSIDIKTIISQRFPKAYDCLAGHLGPEVTAIEQELEEDRSRAIKVTRCAHCGIPLRSENA